MKNIIILLIDALRPKNLSLFGYSKETDKFFKKIAEEEILFKNHFSTSNATAPAITSILTGQYPTKHGIIHQLPYTKQEEIEKVEKTDFWLPNYLKEKGYETICIDWVGLWFRKGFDFYGEEDEENKPSGPSFLSAKETVNLAISRVRKSKKPFFLFTHFWDTHFPFPNTHYESKGDEKDRTKLLESIKDEKQKEYLRKRIAKTNLYTLQEMINKYDLAIKGIDEEIGRFIEFLKSNNWWEDTVFIVLGDHGDNLTTHKMYFSHSGLFDDSIHVPMAAHIPGIEKKELEGLTQHVDIVPTLLEYLGFEKKENLDGKSLIPLIKEGVQIREKILAFDGLCNDVVAVRTKNRKLISTKDSFCNLCKGSHHEKFEEYDLEKDPEELNNIYSGESDLKQELDTLE